MWHCRGPAWEGELAFLLCWDRGFEVFLAMREVISEGAVPTNECSVGELGGTG